MSTTAVPVGRLLRRWRRARRHSQLDLALEAGVSTRHLSFVETGRANPSRDMVLRLARVLDVPLRDQNALLEAAGFAPVFPETPLSAPEMEDVRRVLSLMLASHEPYSAVVIDRSWNVVMANRTHERLLAMLRSGAGDDAPENLLRLLFDPDALRPWVVNWEEVARAVLARLHRQLAARIDEQADALLEEVLAYPDVPDHWAAPDLDASSRLVVPLHLRKDGIDLRLISAIATLGAPGDVTVQELQIESFFPADAATDESLRALHRSAT